MSRTGMSEISNWTLAWYEHLDEAYETAFQQASVEAANIRFLRIFGGMRAHRVFRKAFHNMFFEMITEDNSTLKANFDAFVEVQQFGGDVEDMALRDALAEQRLADALIAREVEIG